MHTFEWLIGLLLGALALSALARRIGVPYPVLLALGGAGLAFVPVAPDLALEPELALALFVAPVLLDAAFDTSVRDLRDNWVAVATLVLVAVGLTTAAVAIVVHAMMPAIPWAAAVALGAIVAPPDAAAATAILRQVKLPHRLVKILEGESLLNDASALLIYRIAVGAAVTQTIKPTEVAPQIALALVGSVVAGYVFAKIMMKISVRIDDPPSAIIFQFATTFLVWIAAEQMHLSGILTIVIYAITIARSAPARTPARIRVPSYAVWETTVFVLNVLAFVLIGMQLRPILLRLPAEVQMEYLAIAGAVLLTIIVVRIAWVMSFNKVLRMWIARTGFNPPRPMMRPSAKGGIVLAWCGMRGIVTLATAYALPESFPYRDLILLSAFVAVLGTLLIQGLTLGPLVSALRFEEVDPVGPEVARARGAAYRAALAAIDDDDSLAGKMLKKEYRAVLERAEGDDIEHGELPGDPLRRRAIAAARARVLTMRETGEIGDDAFHLLEEELDRAELSAGQ